MMRKPQPPKGPLARLKHISAQARVGPNAAALAARKGVPIGSQNEDAPSMPQLNPGDSAANMTQNF